MPVLKQLADMALIDFGIAQIQGARDRQEDFCAVLETSRGLLAVMADGMGGYRGGQLASTTAVNCFIDYVSANLLSNLKPQNLLRFGLEAAHHKITTLALSEPQLERMGTTFTSVLLSPVQAAFISVGDSILWRIRHKNILRLNANHSLAALHKILVEKGEMDAETARRHPQRNVVTSALMQGPIPHIDEGIISSVLPQDVFILATDGILSLSEEQILELAQEDKGKAIDLARNLVDSVVKAEEIGQDNTTVIVLKVPSLI